MFEYFFAINYGLKWDIHAKNGLQNLFVFTYVVRHKQTSEKKVNENHKKRSFLRLPKTAKKVKKGKKMAKKVKHGDCFSLKKRIFCAICQQFCIKNRKNVWKRPFLPKKHKKVNFAKKKVNLRFRPFFQTLVIKIIKYREKEIW